MRNDLPATLRLPLAWLVAISVAAGCQSVPTANQPQAAPKPQVPLAQATPHRLPPPSPALAPAYPVSQAGHHARARQHQHGQHQHGSSCPCCGPGKMPAFAFSTATATNGRGFVPGTLPDMAYTGYGHDESQGPWKPDGIKGPWPENEYVCDGGDLNHDVNVKRDWTVVGLDRQDTVAHFDTLDGQTLVAASNCVCIYSPRFAAARQVSTPIIYEGHERMADVVKPTKVNIHEERRGALTAHQPEQLISQVGLDQVQRLRERNQGLLVDQVTKLVLASDAFLPHEDLRYIRTGKFESKEETLLAERVAAAETWTIHQAVQILIDGKPAVEMRGTAKPEVTYTYETGGKPCLRLCKIADKSEAKPGEIVTFTLRFDNLGEQKIGNVTIIDHLMSRLEYVPGSAQSNLKASFSTQEQAGESVVLRWEIAEPLAVTEGGIVRFKARVR